MFFKGSRYETVEEAEYKDRDGRIIRYKKVRIIPATKAQLTHTVSDGERLDLIAARYYRDPERFWRIADANEAMWPDDLLDEPGSSLLIPPASG